MKRTYIIGSIIAAVILLGLGGWYVAKSIERERRDVQTAAENKPCTAHENQSDNMFSRLKGEEYDKAFIVDMLVHHEGAVAMAEGALAVTDRQEIRQLATAIITAQSQEIVKMRTWQKEWGYPVTATEGHAGHGGNAESMGDNMMEMSDDLRNLSGAKYDEKFLELMIEHHQQAVDMAQYAEANALHQEVKDLSRAVVSDQQAEIKTMQDWQKAWGFDVTKNVHDKPVTTCEL